MSESSNGITRTDVKTGFRSVCHEAGIEDFHFHDLRHTEATRPGDRGVDTRRITAILGNRCIQTSARYTHATDEGLRRAMDRRAQGNTQGKKLTDPVFPTMANRGQSWPLYVVDSNGSGGETRTPDLGVMNPTL